MGHEATALAVRRGAADRVSRCSLRRPGAAGGGGFGWCASRRSLTRAVALASAEAGAAFGDPRVYLERYVSAGGMSRCRSSGDGERVIQLGDRDCSVQRRYQKLIEEAPAPA